MELSDEEQETELQSNQLIHFLVLERRRFYHKNVINNNRKLHGLAAITATAVEFNLQRFSGTCSSIRLTPLHCTQQLTQVLVGCFTFLAEQNWVLLTVRYRQDGDTMSLRFYSTLYLKWDFAQRRQHDDDIFTAGLYDKMTTQHVVSFIAQTVNTSPQETEVSWAIKNVILFYGIMIKH